MDKPAKTVTVKQAEKMYKHFRIHIPKQFRKGKTPEEIQKMRKGLFFEYLLNSGIEIEGGEDETES